MPSLVALHTSLTDRAGSVPFAEPAVAPPAAACQTCRPSEAKGGKMRKCFGLWAAAAVGAALIAGAAVAAPKADAAGLSESLREIGRATERHDCKTVVQLGAPLLDRQAGGLPPPEGARP